MRCLTSEEADEIAELPVTKNRTYADWVQFFLENGATKPLAEALAKSKMEEFSMRRKNENCCRR